MPGADGYATPAKLLHWLSALLVLALIGLGLWMVALPLGLTKLYAYAWHKWIGLTVFGLTLLRLAWRAWRPPPALPATVTVWERALAPWSHALLLVLLVALPLSGWLMSSAGGVKVIWFGYVEMPDLVTRDMALFERLRTLHHWLAWTLMALLAVHIGAVLRHDVLRRDGIFRRMAPFVLLLVILAPRPLLAQTGVWPEWLGSYAGTLRFYRSIPLEDIYPPPKHPHVDSDDTEPFAIRFAIRPEEDGLALWLRIDAGPMQTSADGETLHFGAVRAGVAKLIAAQAHPEPRAATLTLRPDSLGTEALFAFADGSFWRRHFNVRFTPSGADLIVWVFDANGTRARTWRGSALRLP